MPTAEESRALDQAAAKTKKAPALRNARTASVATADAALAGEPQARVMANGAVSMEMDESTHMYSVVRKNASGNLDRYCVHGSDKALSIVKGARSKPAAHQHVAEAKTMRGAAYELK